MTEKQCVTLSEKLSDVLEYASLLKKREQEKEIAECLGYLIDSLERAQDDLFSVAVRVIKD